MRAAQGTLRVRNSLARRASKAKETGYHFGVSEVLEADR